MDRLKRYKWEHASSGLIVEGFELIPREVYAVSSDFPDDLVPDGLVCYAPYDLAEYIVNLHNESLIRERGWA